jgi:hypothetical protein
MLSSYLLLYCTICLFPTDFTTKITYVFLSPHPHCMFNPSEPPWFHYPTNTRWPVGKNSRISSWCNILYRLLISSPLSPNIFLFTLFQSKKILGSESLQKDNGRSAGQETSKILWPECALSCLQYPPSVPILSQINPAHTFPPRSLKFETPDILSNSPNSPSTFHSALFCKCLPYHWWTGKMPFVLQTNNGSECCSSIKIFCVINEYWQFLICKVIVIYNSVDLVCSLHLVYVVSAQRWGHIHLTIFVSQTTCTFWLNLVWVSALKIFKANLILTHVDLL